MSFVAATAVRFSLAGRDVSMSMMLAVLIAGFKPSFVVGDLKLFGDRVVGGENARDCHATSLPIDEGSLEPLGDGNLTISIKRSSNPTDRHRSASQPQVRERWM